jgi:secreted Zn-dependent insulinase-like peptidase
LHKLSTLIITIVCGLTLAGCQQAPSDTRSTAAELNPIDVRKSPNDNRNYRYLTLENKLRVLLVSDPTTDKSAAALAVYRGSFHEPADKSGLAHFLEHMLFIQTETYPEIDGFQTFVSANGGSSNAYTAADHTNYFFDVRPEAFPEALDRWGHFFIDPVISAEYADREKNAVHSEYQMQIKADNWRGFMASKQTLNPEHPGSRFTIGSLDTLAGDIQSDLLKFFDEAYSSDQMGLVVLSNEGLDDLEALVRPIFDQIENKNLGPRPVTVPMYREGVLPAQLDYQSQKQGASVSYGFPMPSTRAYYRTKPEQYFANLIGHEGKGSLYQALSQQGWIESLASGVSAFDDATSLLSVSIQLTPSGVEALESIHDYVFKYLEMLRGAAPQKWLYDEQATVSELGFRFQEKSRPTGFVYQMAPRLQHFPAEDLLVAPYLMESFDAEVIANFLQYLTPGNALVQFSSPDVETDQVEPWFDVPYRFNSGTVARQATTATFSLPPPNEFLPDDLTVKAGDTSTIALAKSEPGLNLWADRDVRYGAPRANLKLQIIIPGGLVSAQERGMGQLYRRMVQDSLSELTYPAYLAGLGYGISVTDAGFEVSVSGYQDKQQVLLRAVLNALTSAELSEDRFNFLKAALIKDWENMARERPYTQLIGAMQDILRSGRWPRDTLIEAMAPVTLNDLQSFQADLFDEVAITGLLNGNIDTTDTDRLAALLSATFDLAAHAAHRPTAGSVSEPLLHEVAIDHNDAAIVIHVQDPSDSFADRATSMLAAQILRPEYFRELRTEQQLGYVVSASNQAVVKRAGISFIVQSPAQGAAYLERATIEFMDRFLAFFEAMPEEDFAQHKAGVITRLLEEPKNLGERSALYWRDILDDYLTFDSRAKMAGLVEEQTKSKLAAYFARVREGLSGNRLMIYNTGRFEKHPTRGRFLSHPADFGE